MIELFSLGDIKTEIEQLGRYINSNDTLGGVNNRHIPFMEKRFSQLTGRATASVNSCTNGIYLSLLRLKLDNEPVLIPPIIFFGVAGAVEKAGGIPVLSETDKNGLMDLSDLGSVLDKKVRGKRIKVIIPAHINGRYVPIEDVERELIVIEDSAPSYGIKKKNSECLISSSTNTSIISFSFAKPLTAGEGGVIFDSTENCEWIRGHRYCGLDKLEGRYGIGNFEVHEPNLKFPFHALGACLITVKLKSFDKNLLRRTEIAKYYNDRLSSLHDAEFYPGSNHLTYMLLTDQREEIEKALNGANIGFYYNHRPVYNFSAFKNLDRISSATDRTTADYFRRVLHIPCREDLTDAEVEKICQVVLKSFS